MKELSEIPSENGTSEVAPSCSLCGGPVEPWPGGRGWGNNPAPLAEVSERCCNLCNVTKVIPARLAEMGMGPSPGSTDG